MILMEMRSQEKRAEESGLPVVGEALQYDWMLSIKSNDALRAAVNIFKKYASKFKLDYRGSKVKRGNDFLMNSDQIIESWDVPLLVCSNAAHKKPSNLRDFLTVSEFLIDESIGNERFSLQTFVGSKRKDFEEILIELGKTYSTEKCYVLRVFVENYLEL